MQNPLISVAIITYNQEDYIKKAVLSVLEQQGNFDLEIIIGDDCSSDSTSEICEQLRLQYPSVIKHIRNQKNLGYIENLLNVIRNSSGEYIALLEADDYWTTPVKLQDQLNVFATHPAVSLCFTNSLIDDLRVAEKKQYFERTADIEFTATDCFRHCVAPTSSFMFRKSMFTPPEWFSKLITYEYFLIYLLAGKGNIYYLNKTTSCRTQHYRGLSASTIKVDGDRELFYEVVYKRKIIEAFPKALKKKVQNTVLNFQIQTATTFISRSNFAFAKNTLREIKISQLNMGDEGAKTIFRFTRLLLKYYVARWKMLPSK